MSMLQQQEQQRQEALSEASGGGTHDSFDRESLRQEFDVISYSEWFPFIVLTIVAGVLLVLAVIAFFVVRRIMRTRRLERMLSKEPAEQVERPVPPRSQRCSGWPRSRRALRSRSF